MSTPPPLLPKEQVLERLRLIFPEGHAKGYGRREIAASTVWVMLYIGATEEGGVELQPKHVYRMSDEQAALGSEAARRDYNAATRRSGSLPLGRAWYADNSREPIRDETLRDALLPCGAPMLTLRNKTWRS